MRLLKAQKNVLVLFFSHIEAGAGRFTFDERHIQVHVPEGWKKNNILIQMVLIVDQQSPIRGKLTQII